MIYIFTQGKLMTLQKNEFSMFCIWADTEKFFTHHVFFFHLQKYLNFDSELNASLAQLEIEMQKVVEIGGLFHFQTSQEEVSSISIFIRWMSFHS